jgi:hypothetical protein
MPCAKCLRERKTKPVQCSECGKEHPICGICARAKKVSAVACRVKAHKISQHQAEEILEKAQKAKDADASRKKKMQACKRKQLAEKAYVPPQDAVVKKTDFGPSDPEDIVNNPLRYVHVRANEIWKANPTLFGQTTACVTIIECGEGVNAKRSVLLTSCNEGPNPLAELTRQAKEGEVCVDPDPIVHRVRHKLKPAEKKKNAKKPKDTVFVARLASSNPVVDPTVSTHPDYASAQKSMSGRNPPYTVTSLYPSDDPNETHAEQRAIAVATARGCKVIAQAPTIGCCDECRTDLGATGLAKVPAERQSSAAYNDYRNKTLKPTIHAMKQEQT